MTKNFIITAPIFSYYITRRFFISTFVMLASLTGLICLFDFIDLLRRITTKPHVSPLVITQITLLHIPFFSMKVLPFSVLLGGIVCFWHFTKTSELIVARAAGISAWQFLTAPVACALLMGALATMLGSPISSTLYHRAENLDRLYLRTNNTPFYLGNDSFWVRQSDPQNGPAAVAILHAQKVQLKHSLLTLYDITLFRLNKDGQLITRIDAPSGSLAHGHWILNHTETVQPNSFLHATGRFLLPTNLTLKRIEESFSSPDTFSIWTLPRFITMLDQSGFSSIRHRIRFQSLLALPALTGTMTLIAASFSMRPSRYGGIVPMIGAGVFTGFLLFIIAKISEQFGNSGILPAVIAAWTPTLTGFCFAVSLLLHLEDG
ncbi:MAG: LPS export ABC transporter permease LptG [Acetobacter sp.]|nr:LPS export ABC transporter permease LptG [Acetobacter sp.]